ncbi:phosphoribosyl-AMP cyclohydrolase, partial [Prevotella sp.]|uniref:phosphoribosyl-AMP cyclohydrolase n=1 Tax=Prevotella sp. TaxID=59823 RepID=UPI002A816F84
KGLTSGHVQYVKSLSLDCDNDTILAKVAQVGAACHTGKRSCFFQTLMKKEYDDIVAHAKPKWVEEGRKEEREDNIKKTIPVILQLGGTIQDVANIFDTTPEEIQKILDVENN